MASVKLEHPVKEIRGAFTKKGIIRSISKKLQRGFTARRLQNMLI